MIRLKTVFMARTHSAAVTATGDNTAFRIGVPNVGTVVLERPINGTEWAADRETGEMLAPSNVAGANGALRVMFPA